MENTEEPRSLIRSWRSAVVSSAVGLLSRPCFGRSSASNAIG